MNIVKVLIHKTYARAVRKEKDWQCTPGQLAQGEDLSPVDTGGEKDGKGGGTIAEKCVFARLFLRITVTNRSEHPMCKSA